MDSTESGNGASVHPMFEEVHHTWVHSNFETTVGIINSNARDVLDGRTLRFNEMTGAVELGSQPVLDFDLSHIRLRIAREFIGQSTKKGGAIGMKQSVSDIDAACSLVARGNSFHPVRDWLSSLKWDGVERIASVCEDILSAEMTDINRLILRRWFVSAVARAMRPGCKVDTSLVLVGRQGVGKSTFFRELAGEWFVDSPIDIQNKDSFQVIRQGWIVEWSELETVRKARDVSAVKAFLSSPSDLYRAPFGRKPENVPRNCVIVGTTNNEEFLTDDTGNRRFWPIRVGQTDTKSLRAMRDQLWAEAASLYQAGETWWLTEEESAPLASVHREHETSDPWAHEILGYARGREEVTVREILKEALEIEVGRWTRADEMRIASVLKRASWKKGRKLPHAPRSWFPPSQEVGPEQSSMFS